MHQAPTVCYRSPSSSVVSSERSSGLAPGTCLSLSAWSCISASNGLTINTTGRSLVCQRCASGQQRGEGLAARLYFLLPPLHSPHNQILHSQYDDLYLDAEGGWVKVVKYVPRSTIIFVFCNNNNALCTGCSTALVG